MWLAANASSRNAALFFISAATMSPGPMPREISQGMHRAIEDAQRQHGGKILSADRMRNDGRDVYRVKLLTPAGRVRVVQMPENEAPDASGRQQQQGEK